MLKLAQWIMGGRFNALVAAAVLGVLPFVAWTSASVVALVALRRSAADALWPMAGATLVALTVHWNSGDITQLGTLLTVFAGALVLANTRSLPRALLTVCLGAALYLAILMQWMPHRFDPLVDMFKPFFDQIRKAEPEQFLNQIDPRRMVEEIMGLMTGLSALVALLLARWLQAKLYNPGGFRTEFHQLRIPPAVTGVLMLGLLASQWLDEAMVVAPLLMLPLLLAGIALVHGLLGRTGNRNQLVLFYVMLVVFAGPAFVVLIAAAITDSFLDFRNRIGTTRP